MSSKAVVNRFPQAIQTLSPEDQGFRQFIVTMPEYIEVPGCRLIEELRVGAVTMPAFETHKYPTDSTHSNFKEIEIPMYALVQGPAGHPAIVRSLNSNDGRWQVGAIVYVKGEFGDAGESDGLRSKSLKELIEIAKNEFGEEFPAVGTKKADVIAFIESHR